MRLRVLLISFMASLGVTAASAEDTFPEPDSARLREIDDYKHPEQQTAHFKWNWLDEALDPWEEFKNRLDKEWGLDFFIAYSPQFQRSTQEDKSHFEGDETDLIGE